ncbi:glycosyltransferase family 2 protein [Nocardioides sp. cx-169]|uniref:glycosyltransferase family 2 protein n=1 Tax=Nocardioides sp. cx-169 TaxID=2899080 RepID=UPI001E2DDE58|nr:glycosyltransferase family 2 protein [Nocardioides sp. cx-169]MCD4534136.1 glycosyltransferase family 2 protein [Nocardioides sp. cx-169]
MSGTSVAALLVSHDGGRWLPTVIQGLRAQTRPVDRVLAVDTGSKDGSADLLEQAFGPDSVLRTSGATHFPAAVGLALERLSGEAAAPGGPVEWVWILHDDANPDPAALATLLAAAQEHPEADVLGPTLREWPSLRRLLEVGITISGTGRRETGLERGEFDQGQHSAVRRVLAVNTAGMLVRRRVLEELEGFDDQLPIFGNDLDFGWRAAAAGHTTLVVPEAVVFHAEAAHRGVRRTPLTGRHTHYQERRAALYTLLVNARGRALPFQVLRLGLGTLVRMVGFLLVRSVGEALDELAALVSLYSSPRRVLAARRERQGRQVADPAEVRALLAPPWLPYRHGLDFVSDLAAAATHQAADVAERRRAAAIERDPSSLAARRPVTDDDEEAFEDSGAVARFLTNPIAVLLSLFVLAAVLSAREAFGTVVGGGLSPVPDSAGAWWGLYLESWHPLGQGTAVPAPAYLLPLALVASVLGPGLSVSALLVLAVPGGVWGAWRFLRVVGRLVSHRGAPRWVLLWGATTYALVPITSGAWGDGRLGPVVAAVLLPWLAHAALGFADPSADRRWRAGWRTALLLALTTAFAPVAWLFGLAVGLVVVAAAFAIVPSAMRDRSTWGPPATAIAAVPVLLAPWWVPLLLHGAAAGLVLDIGRLPAPRVESLDLLTGRLGELGAPWWLGAILLAAAVLALVPRATRIPVLVCWVVALVAGALAAVLGNLTITLDATTTQPGVSFLVVVLQGAFVVAATLGGQGLLLGSAPRRPAGRSLVAAVAVLATVVPIGGLVWFGAGGHDRLADAEDTDIPAYMVQSSRTGDAHGILVVRGSVEDGLTYTVRRGDGVTLGEDEILDLDTAEAGFTELVTTLLSRPTPGVVSALAEEGIEYVVLPAPADGSVAAALDATPGLVQASAEERTTRAWQVARPLDQDAVDGPRSWVRIGLLVLQAVAIVVVAVLCAPSTRRGRR